MSNTEATALAIVGGVSALTALLTFALIRRVRFIEERLVGRSAELPSIGTRVGPFRAVATDGGSISLKDMTASTTLAFLSPECPACDAFVARLGHQEGVSGQTLLAFVVGDREDDGAVRLAVGLREIGCRVALIGEAHPAVAACRVTAYPTLIRVEDGRVMGAGHTLEAVVESAAKGRILAGASAGDS